MEFGAMLELGGATIMVRGVTGSNTFREILQTLTLFHPDAIDRQLRLTQEVVVKTLQVASMSVSSDPTASTVIDVRV
jgi:hypothetical protein